MKIKNTLNKTISLSLIMVCSIYLSKNSAKTTKSYTDSRIVDFKQMDTKTIHSNKNLIWRQFGPGGSGNNYFIHWHPTDPNTVFQGPNMGNSYRSTDKGNTYMGIMNCDGPNFKTRDRGPSEMSDVDFSRQNENFGICTIEDKALIYFTNDKGLNWRLSEKVSNQFNGNHISALCVDPTNDNIWYAGSGMMHNCNYCEFTYAHPHGINSFKNKTATIWKSTDKGQNWEIITPKNINTDAMFTRIMVSPKDHNTIYAASTYGFYISKNQGKTWRCNTKSGLDNNIIRSFDLNYDKKTKQITMYVIDQVKFIPTKDDKSITYNGGIFKSINEGKTWINITADMPIPKSILKDKTITKTLYQKTLPKWFEISSKEAESKYSVLPPKLLQAISVVRVDPNNKDKIFVLNDYKSHSLYSFAGGMMWRTDNGGKHWFVTLRNGKAWEGKDKEIWQKRNNPTSHNVHWALQKEWELRDPYDRKSGATIEFNADGSLIMYQLAKIVCVSTDGGDTWYENDEKQTAPNSKNWVGAGNSNMPGEEIIQDLRLGGKLYFCSGENSIWETTNDGYKIRKNAQAVHKLNIPNTIDPDECSVCSMSVDPKDKNTLYSLHFRQAFFGKIMKSTDSGFTWKVLGKIFDVPSNPVKRSIHQFDLTIDENDTKYFYCCVPKKHISNVTVTDGAEFKDYGFYRSKDAGKTWQLMNNGLQTKNGYLNYEMQNIALDPDGSGRIYGAVMGNEKKPGGLFKLEKGSNKWEKLNLPNNMVSVHDIFFAVDKKMYISGGTPNGNVKDGGVWFTKDYKSKSIKWEQIFPYKFANQVRVALYDPNVIMVGVPYNGMLNPGIFRSLNGGKTWQKVNYGNLQSDRITDLQIDKFQKGIYWCSTYGAGYYKGIDENLINKK